MDFLSFLQASQSLASWQTTGRELLYIVLSNEACDLDSCISTLTLAYLRYRNRGAYKNQFMPILNMLRCDYPTRSEVRFVFERHNIQPQTHLNFRDDVPDSLLMKCRYILVNHHISPFYYNVEEIYDHYPVQRDVARLPVHCQRIIRPMLSCAAVVTERYASGVFNMVNVRCPIVYELLHAAVLLQSWNFPRSTAPQSELDYYMLMFLEQQLGAASMAQKRLSIYHALTNAFFDLNHLTMPQILRREFKLLRASNGMRLVRLALCTFPMAITKFISYEQSHVALQQFAIEHDCDFLLLLGTSLRPEGELAIKELGLIPLDELRDVEERRFFDHMIINLHGSLAPRLTLQPYCGLDFMQGAFYFLNAWTIKVPEVLRLVERIIYDWVAEDICA